MNGLYQVVEEILTYLLKKWQSIRKTQAVQKQENPAEGSLAIRLLRIVLTFVLIDFAWVFFRAESLGQAFSIIRSMVTAENWWVLFDGSLFGGGLIEAEFGVMLCSLIVLLGADFLAYRNVSVSAVIERQPVWFRWAVYLTGILTIVVFGVWGSGYSATSFIYFQF